MQKSGVVYLVGAGPGDPDYITRKGLLRLACCEVLVYDHLVSERFLKEVPADCRKIYVGKQAGHHSMKQEEINRILVEEAKAGRTVVRLKGGDPFVFGRGGEEIQALSAAHIPYEVVSGVTSAVAALAGAGIPVTHRLVSRSFHVMTGHIQSEEGGLPQDFPEFARLNGTLIFLMGLGHLAAIVEGLLKAGKPERLPAAVVENGTLPGQRVVRGTLADIVEKAGRARIASPAIIVAGEAAGLDFSATAVLPLKGVTVGVTGTVPFVNRLTESLERSGAQVREMLTLTVATHRKEAAMREAYARLERYGWVVFTSANAVREFFSGLMESGRDLRSLGRIQFATIGRGTAKALRDAGFLTDYTPRVYQAVDLAEGLVKRVSGQERILIPRSSGGSRKLNAILDREGIPYDDLALYDVTCQDPCGLQVPAPPSSLDYLTFASASGVHAFFERRTEEERAELDAVKVVCIGRITADALEEYGRNADIVARECSVPGILEAICQDRNLKKS